MSSDIFPFLIPISIVFIVVGIPVICGTLVKLAKIVRGDPMDEPKHSRTPKSSSTSTSTTDETRLIQEIHRSMSRLESRIDSIETIVLQGEPSKVPPRHD